MKCNRILFALYLLFLAPSLALASEISLSQWDSLLDVSYRFTWYPQSDLQSLLEEKGREYGMSLEDYREAVQNELGIATGTGGRLDAASMTGGKAWKKYFLLSQAEYVLFLNSGNSVHLDNARVALSTLEAREQLDVSFWSHFFQTHSALEQNDRQAFMRGVFDVWQNDILKLEVDDLRLQGDLGKAGFIKSLPYLYENLAHLIITRAIIEKEMSNLAPLGAIILALKGKLTVENGYRTVVEAVAERMSGINSDNHNLNFAVAFLEATASRNTFEEEKDPARLVDRFNRAEKFYRLALTWANTKKGRAAVLPQYLGFLNYVTRRLSDPQDPLTGESFFAAIPGTADHYLDQAIALYDDLAGPKVQEEGIASAGFRQSDNYLAAMHKLWDASAKLAIMLGTYYKGQAVGQRRTAGFPAETPLLKYCALFDRHARTNQDIVPDNAFFLVAFAAGELAGIYREQGEFSTDSRAGDLFFGYQLQAVEIFPMDILGILQLAYQSSLDGKIEGYFSYTSPIAQRLRGSEPVRRWRASNQTEYDRLVAAVPSTVPQIMDNAYPLINFIQDTGGSEDGMYRKTLAMNQVLFVTAKEKNSQIAEKLLRAVGSADFSDGTIVLDDGLRSQIPLQVADHVQQALSESPVYHFGKLKNELYASLTSPVHSLLRELFYEIPYGQHQYPKILQKYGHAAR
ncbi:MAG: hypothetical protein R2940_05195 [Syntrophotaleaceae bacterium]